MSEGGARLIAWAQNAAPTQDRIEAMLEGEGLSAYPWSNGPGDRYAAHSHGYGKVIYVVRGSITFGLPDTGDRLEMQPGDRLELDRGVVHDAIVGREGVVCLEGHR
jgi:quercetin dioxygenase-like cupin family protein